MTLPRVLSIAGTDPTGGAGIQADLKSIAAVGGFGMAAVTALVAQNTRGVRSVHTPPPSFLRQQLDAVSADVRIDAVKIGMLGGADVVRTVTDWLSEAKPPIVVLDPVMVATSGDRLLAKSSEDAVRSLATVVDLVTPNLAELAVLTGSAEATQWHDALAQGRQLADSCGVRVLVKGGHLGGPACPDALISGSGSPFVVDGPRITATTTHGTGCSMSSALATLRASRGSWEDALTETKAWLTDSIRHGPELHVGSGNGPVHHFHALYERAGLGERAEPGGLAEPEPAAVAAAPPAGPETAALWRDTEPVRRQIDALDFVRGLGDGTLAEEHFTYYLAQDAMYLRDYSRALARASQLAPTAGEQAFWARAACGAITEEGELHRTWLAGHPADPGRGRALDAYAGLLRESGGTYPQLVAAVLPCFWIYQDVGARLHARRTDGHPYAAWLDTYADPEFAASVTTAIGYAETALAGAPGEERAAAADAFAAAASLERDFFAAPMER
ncbi:bifunctional hydroxymethylpyrimidine kinase/phosphomethylpyrimidine kinase [Spelaeicoccus albus]|uniref:Hydroxymethylpyrimidine/phosphomethylpyrimidine kinase n=1 Tax=Spelaeicoccus albus TaxID=1280376 RepID=A0A7Z0A7D1_9MICO|nr:bifunctional hydroxymethylpyrimidine kinase/phosphomethylpyrimidine kinase [Spelaeicoccus albus]NYI65762.1 hydroxymethylpyrimidine/phosphomethylpyrimidine kinase [Spelaeicoccus albus]